MEVEESRMNWLIPTWRGRERGVLLWKIQQIFHIATHRKTRERKKRER